ncbi:helix-turn-helix domain-containing protein [Siccirubricoccus sp. KC 17139]|uniref:Helix-turn-helix domain-containing protein n=1 Tax=Siccirubricoccus soli TaxID=2899147 RepID=A0ABT1DD28_9PROT|nr:helix-turn-helix domain-containing protein [Siccirubricoccus soli]MCO6419847.1 helix-turn-helix domain-containing protein [Siccirubricoccus soli]MCP2685982.1 helix-turn-helix domain-containing protein [Siccirubricoccus soli]
MTNGQNVGVDPPGVYIKMELEARGWSQRDLAFILGQTEQQLSPMLSGKRAITPDMARLLGDAFDMPAQFFANLQSLYDLSNAKSPDPAVRTRATLQTTYPVRDMIRRGWIEDGEASLLQLQIERFFEVANDDAPSRAVAFAAKRTHYDETPPHQLAWVFRIRQLARQIKVPAFSADRLRAALPRLRALMVEAETAREVPAILAECGVRFVIVEVLPNAKIDGVCTWLDDEAPVIGMSTLYDRLDNFWFVLRHEIEHVLLGHGKATAVGMIDHLVGEGASEGNDVAQEERVANLAAADFCVPRQKMDSFYARKHPYFSERDVVGFASLMQLHPGIVVGQLQRRMGRYDYLRKYQVPVRRHVIERAVTDGWGQAVKADL